MTSNIGADLIKGGAGFGFAKRDEQQDFENIKGVLNKEIERYFRPEFINRLDDIIVFRPLTKDDLITIVDYETQKLVNRMKEQGWHMELDQAAKDFLIDKGFNPDYGARPLRRAISQYVEDPLSEALLSGDFEGKNRIIMTRKDDEEKLTFELKYDKSLEKKKEPKPKKDGDDSKQAKAAEAGAEST